MRRGDIWLTDLGPTTRSEIRKTRPAVIVQNDISNKYSATTIVVPITSQKTDRIYPTEVSLRIGTGLEKPSKAVCDQIRTVDKARLRRRLGMVSRDELSRLDRALRVTLALY